MHKIDIVDKPLSSSDNAELASCSCSKGVVSCLIDFNDELLKADKDAAILNCVY